MSAFSVSMFLHLLFPLTILLSFLPCLLFFHFVREFDENGLNFGTLPLSIC
jgi:hypothetical protein